MRDDWRNISITLTDPQKGEQTAQACAMAFHEKAGRSQVESCLASLNNDFFFRRVATVAMLPFALSRSDFIRSVQFGRSRFSRCCYLISALWFGSFESRTWARP